MGSTSTGRSRILSLTTDIVSAYVGNNSIASSDLPTVIKDVFGGLNSIGHERTVPKIELAPAVPVKQSVGRHEITCLECGKKRKVLKQHLRIDHGLTPDDYRQKWGLSRDYPLIAPSYSEVRKKLAEDTGLGRKVGANMIKRLRKT